MALVHSFDCEEVNYRALACLCAIMRVIIANAINTKQYLKFDNF